MAFRYDQTGTLPESILQPAGRRHWTTHARDLRLASIAVGQIVTHYALCPAKLPQQHAREFVSFVAPVVPAEKGRDAPHRRQAAPKLRNGGCACCLPPSGHLVPHAPSLTGSTASHVTETLRACTNFFGNNG